MFSSARAHLAQVDLWVARIQSEAALLRKNPDIQRVYQFCRETQFVLEQIHLHAMLSQPPQISLETMRDPCDGRS
jgi:hypothetical protein